MIADFGLRIENVILFAFGFGNLAMLGWLAAAAAPLLIHLWSRHRFRESPWAAMQFLLAAMRKNARRLQLQQWLLLAVRTLIILLVVLAVAEPYGERLLASGSAGPTHKVIVIDGSYSMAYRANGATNFTVAKQLAAEMVSASHPGDAFTVILMTSSPKFVISSEVFDHAVTAQIESLVQPQAGADLAATLALIHEALAEKFTHSTPAHKEVYFLTDLQTSTWGGLAKNAKDAGSKKQSDTAATVAAITERASLVVVDLSQANVSNLAMTNLSASAAVVTSGHDINLNAALHNFSQEPHTQTRAELLVDDAVVGKQTIDLAAGGESSIHFAHRFASSGVHTVTIRTSGDRLELDNSRSLAVPVRSEIRVLCVSGHDGAAKYLSNALNPNPGGDSPIRPMVIAEGDLADAQLADFDCVFLCNVAQLTSSEAERLTHYAESGGGVVVFLGDRVVPASYNAPLQGGTGDRPSLLPAVVGPIVAQPQFGLDPLDYRHPIVAPFRGRERAGLLTTPVNRYYRLEVSRSRPGVEIAAALPGGDPFIVTAPLGRGRTVLVATDGSLSSVDPASGEAWTTWPTWPSFLPLVRELLAYASGGQQMQWQQLVESPLSGSIGEPALGASGSGELKMVRPDGRATAVSIRSTPTGSEWSYTDTDVSGIFTLRGLPQGRTQQFAINVDTAEGDLARIDPQQLPSEIKVRSNWQGEASGGDFQSAAQADWNTEILWGVLALLFAESFMAWQFGRGAL